MTDFAGKVALVAGAASGIGEAVAARLLAAGAEVYCADLNVQGVEVVAGSGPKGHTLALDVRDEAAWIAATERILAADGRLDVLVNCVGVSAASPLAIRRSPSGGTSWRPIWTARFSPRNTEFGPCAPTAA